MLGELTSACMVDFSTFLPHVLQLLSDLGGMWGMKEESLMVTDTVVSADDYYCMYPYVLLVVAHQYICDYTFSNIILVTKLLHYWKNLILERNNAKVKRTGCPVHHSNSSSSNSISLASSYTGIIPLLFLSSIIVSSYFLAYYELLPFNYFLHFQ